MVSEGVLKGVLSGVLSGALSGGLIEGLLPSSWPMTDREFRTRAQRGSDFCATVESRHGEERFPPHSHVASYYLTYRFQCT